MENGELIRFDSLCKPFRCDISQTQFKNEVNMENEHLWLDLASRVTKLEGANKMTETEWCNAEDWKPEDDYTILVTFWCGTKYSSPIRAYYSKDDERFFAVDSLNSYPLDVDLWCKMPEVPSERQ